jgi:hypothetical protein
MLPARSRNAAKAEQNRYIARLARSQSLVQRLGLVMPARFPEPGGIFQPDLKIVGSVGAQGIKEAQRAVSIALSPQSLRFQSRRLDVHCRPTLRQPRRFRSVSD